VLPEGFARNDLILPPGAVCDACNHYLGHELDAVLVSHPIISLIAQSLRLPGKDGTVRDSLGGVRTNVRPKSVTIPCAEPRVVKHPDGSTTATAEPLIDRSFRFDRFRRALHHCALNAWALRRGVSAALDSRMDPVRRYVRNPKPSETWPFLQYADLERGFARDATIFVDGFKGGAYVALTFGKTIAFAVDLLGHGQMLDYAEHSFGPGKYEVVGPEYRPPRAAKQGRRRFRLTIVLED
jgi:hypothetical protein